MAFTIKLFKFNKKVNSTKTPSNSDTSISLSCNIKTSSSIINPKVEVKTNPIEYNYAYIESFDRYYFINDITYNIGVWVLDLNVDVLASFKNSINSSTQYVLRSYSQYDGKIVDDFYPTIADVTSDVKYLDGNVVMGTNVVIQDYFSRKINTGAFVFGVIGGNTSGITYYVTSYTGLGQLIQAISSYFPSDMTDVSNGIAKQLADPMQYITSVFWYPAAPQESGGYTTIKFGEYSINIQATVINVNDYVKYFNSTVDVPKHPKYLSRGEYLNLSPFSQYILDFKPFGYFNLDTTMLNECSKLALRWYVDFTTGEASLGVYKNGDYSLKLLNADCMYGIPIRLSEVSIDYMGTIGSIISGTSSIASGNIGGIFGSIGSAVQSMTPQPSTKGTSGSFLQQYIYPCIYGTFNDIVDTDDVNNGRPLCSKKVLSSLSGYVQCANAYIEGLISTENEKEKILNYLNGGLYLE